MFVLQEVGVPQEDTVHTGCRRGERIEALDLDGTDREESIGNGRKKQNDVSWENNSKTDHASNGDYVHKHFEHVLSIEEHGRASNNGAVRNDPRDQRNAMSSDSGGKKQRGAANSPLRNKHYEEGHGRNHLKSAGQSRGRSESHNSFQEVSQSDTPKEQDDAYYSKRRHRNDSDDERAVKSYKDQRHGSSDLLRDKERERSSSYDRHGSQMGRHHSRETRERYREGSREMDRDRSRERERARERERERERGRERDKEREKDRERERERERRRDLERERRRERDRESSKDRGRDRESNKDRNRDRDRGRENDRFTRNHKYDYLDDGYGGRDRHDDSRSRRYGETDRRDRPRENDDRENVDNSDKKVLGSDNEESKRYLALLC